MEDVEVLLKRRVRRGELANREAWTITWHLVTSVGAAGELCLPRQCTGGSRARRSFGVPAMFETLHDSRPNTAADVRAVTSGCARNPRRDAVHRSGAEWVTTRSLRPPAGLRTG